MTGVTVDDPVTGVLVDGGSATISGGTIEHNDTGIDVTNGGSASISANQISNNTIGIRIDSDSVTVTNNFIDGNHIGILVDSNGTNAEVHANSITSNTIAGLENNSAYTVDATGNWWGGSTDRRQP